MAKKIGPIYVNLVGRIEGQKRAVLFLTPEVYEDIVGKLRDGVRVGAICQEYWYHRSWILGVAEHAGLEVA